MNNSVEKYNLDVFIKGENVDLCIPSQTFAQTSTWYSWFNNSKVNRFLEQGMFPNTPERQMDFFNKIQISNDRISLIISDREQYIGTVSLSFINLIKRTADIAILIGESSQMPRSEFFALEAMATLTEFGFEKLGLVRISAGQHERLKAWQSLLELIGYRVDGFFKYGFIKGPELANSIKISINKDDYKDICEKRGRLWDTTDLMKSRAVERPRELFVDKLRAFMAIEGEKYYQTIFELN